ncbi:MAG: hypothetical protein NTV58_17790 [Deltaproteobacteria bacterium]|nr:hypothetical protein [Deltaproteobacteria bacterium]
MHTISIYRVFKNHKELRILLFSVFIFFFCAGVCFAAIKIQTGDGLSIQFDENGNVSRTDFDDKGSQVKGIGGFYAKDIASGSETKWFRGKMEGSKTDAVFVASSPALQLNLLAQIRTDAKKIMFDLTLTSLSKLDRSLAVGFALPIDALGWYWYDHLREKRKIEAGKIYEESVTVPAGESGKMARYCWSAISNDQVGLALGLPMDSPAVYRLIYDSQSKQLIIRYDIGLTKDSKIPSTVKIRFILYKIDEPAWGMRSALKKYYEMYPQWFEKRVKKEGIWKNFGRIEDIPNWEDFQIGFHEQPVDAKALEFDRQNDIKSFYYDEPWDFWLHMPKGKKYSYDDVLSYLKETGNKPGPHKNGATLSSALHDESGRVIGSFKDESWSYGGWFPLNCAPELPTVNSKGINAARYSANEYLKNVAKYDGIYIDGSPEYTGNYLNFRRDHFKFTDFPLTFSSKNKKVAIFNLLTNYEYLSWLNTSISHAGLLTMCNGAMRASFGFYNHLIDIPGTEVWWATAPNQMTPEPDSRLSFRRAFSYKKPYLLLMTGIQKFNHDMVKQYLGRSLFYGFYPAMNGGAEKKGDDWQRYEFYKSDMQKRDQQLFRDYLQPIVQTSRAGWEPLTYAVSSKPDVFVERFGYGENNTLRFTCLNSGKDRTNFDLFVDARKIRVGSRPVYAVDVLGHTFLKLSVSETQIQLKDVFLSAGDVTIIQIGSLDAIIKEHIERTVTSIETVLRDLNAAAKVVGKEETKLSLAALMKKLGSQQNVRQIENITQEMMKTKIAVDKFAGSPDWVSNPLLYGSSRALSTNLEFVLSMFKQP